MLAPPEAPNAPWISIEYNTPMPHAMGCALTGMIRERRERGSGALYSVLLLKRPATGGVDSGKKRRTRKKKRTRERKRDELCAVRCAAKN